LTCYKNHIPFLRPLRDQSADGLTCGGKNVAHTCQEVALMPCTVIGCDKLARCANRVRNRIPSCAAAM
jgi:hypothetical protein